VGIGPEHGRDQDERYDPQAQRNAKHGTGVVAGELVREQR
jgi:hypothetical protein